MSVKKIHYFPLQFGSSPKTYCGAKAFHGMRFVGSWLGVTCKKCIKQKEQDDKTYESLKEHSRVIGFELDCSFGKTRLRR